jgi:transposase
VVPRVDGRLICSGCCKPGQCYDHLELRLFEHVPLWGFKTFFAYTMRRVDCKRCGVTVEMIPWSEGKKQITIAYEWFLSEWAKRLSWEEVGRVFGSSWDTVFRAVTSAVEWGKKHRDLAGITAIGVDEISRRKGHHYATMVYQIDSNYRRLLWVGESRKEKTLEQFFKWFGKLRTKKLEAICSDMWKPYIKTIASCASGAIHVLDRFHIMSQTSKAIDKIRATETRQLEEDGYEPLLKKSRWLLLKRAENLTEKQEPRLKELLRYNLKSVRAYLLKEDFQNFWMYSSPSWAGKFLDKWCTRAMRSRLEPMKEMSRTLRNHRDLILNWFEMKGEISQGIVEGFNNKARVTTKKAYGYRTFKVLEIALYHQLGDLPLPDHVPKFC